MENIAAVILAPGSVNSEKDPDMDLNTLDTILKRADIPEVYRKLIVERHKKFGEKIIKKSHYTRIQSGLRSSMREPEEIKQRALWRGLQRNY